MKFAALALLATVATVHAGGARVVNDNGDLKLAPGSTEGTTVFVEPATASGSVSIREILANLVKLEANADALKVYAEQEIAAKLEEEAVKTQGKFDTVDLSVKAVIESIRQQKINQEAYTNDAIDASVTQVITPKLAALETKINDGVTKDLAAVKTTQDKILVSLMGSSVAFPAKSCTTLKAARKHTEDGWYFVTSPMSTNTIEVYCKTVGSSFVSMGGDGSTKEEAGAGCSGNDRIAVASGKLWVDPDANAEGPQNAVQKQCTLATCLDYKKAGFNTDGVYEIKPKKWTGAGFKVWCDMTRDGGGWTFTEMHSEGYNNQPKGRHFPDKGANEELLVSRGDVMTKWKSGNQGDFASHGQAKIDAVYHEHGAKTVLRSWNAGKYFNNGNTPVNFYYQKKNPQSSFSVFHAIRNTRLWTDDIRGNAAYGDGGNGFKHCYKDPPFGVDKGNYDPDRGITGRRGFNGYMRWWDQHTITGNSGKNVKTSRHGIPGDPFGGCQWNFYFYGGNGRRSYGNCGRMKYAFYWLR